MGHFEEARLLIEDAIRRGIESPQAQQLLMRAKDSQDNGTQHIAQLKAGPERALKESLPASSVAAQTGKPPQKNQHAKTDRPSSKPIPHQGKNPSHQEINALAALFNNGRYAEVEALAQRMTERFPMHGFGWKVLGAVFKQMGRIEDALAPMQKAAE